MKKLKICLISNTSWSFTRFRPDLIKALIADGHDVLLLAPGDDQTAKLVAWGARVIVLEKLARKGLNPVSDIRLYAEFKSIYRAERPDLVFQYTIKPNIYSTLAASINGIPAIAVITGLGYAFINSGVVTRIAKQLYRFALRRATQVWFLNRDDLAYFQNHRLVDGQKTSLIPGEGINCLETFNPALIPATRQTNDGHVRFLFIGRLLFDKGISEYVEAAKRVIANHPGVTFSILGYLNVDNPAAVREAELAEWVNSGWVDYLGAVEDVRPIIAAHDCVVLPSYREGMSTTLQESAAMAKPLIATDIPGCKELVDDEETGYLCKVKEVDDLVDCLERFIKLTPLERTQMGANGREKMIREYAIDKILLIYNQTISAMLDGEKG